MSKGSEGGGESSKATSEWTRTYIHININTHPHLGGAVLHVVGPKVPSEGPVAEQGGNLPVEEEGEHVGGGDAQPAVQVEHREPLPVVWVGGG